ncbi:hypothetical protein ACFX2I_009501 [Malus domestica]
MDLNADVVLADPSDGVHHSEPALGVVGEVNEMASVGGGVNGGVEEKGEVVDGGDDSEVKLGLLDGDVEGKGSVVLSEVAVNGGEGREGLEGPQFGAGGVVGENVNGLVLKSEDSLRNLEIGRGRGEDATLGECTKDEVVGSEDGDLVSVKAKRNVAVHGRDDMTIDEKEENVVRVADIAPAEIEMDQKVEQGQVEDQSLDASSSMHGNGDVEYLETVGQITEGTRAVEVKVVDHSESLDKKDLNVSTQSKMETCDGLENQPMEVNVEAQTNENKLTHDVSENGVRQNTENGKSTSSDGNVSSDENGKSASTELEFRDSDLVWGKVRSHPWWPGQICDPSAASVKAKKYFKRGTYLIMYYWDNTFAWNEAMRIKPFFENFSQMEKQSDMEEFQNAIGCALDEVSRRVELGLSCSCISKEVYEKLKTQIIENAGISEEASRRDGGDKSLSAASFEPVKLIRFVKKLAQFPYRKVDRLELVTSRAQLSAFNRWKGCPPLPEFNMLGGLLTDADILLLGEKQCAEASENALPVIKDEDLGPKSKSKDNLPQKRKNMSGDSTRPSKKEKSIPDVVAEKYFSTPVSEKGSEGKAGSKLISQSSSKKRKAGDATSDDSAVKRRKSELSTRADSNSIQNKPTFKVGDRIRRVASQLSGLSPILKSYNATSGEVEVGDKGKRNEYPSPDKMLSQVCLAAIDPMNGYSFLSSMITCFREFRNTICLDHSNPAEDQMSLEQMFGGKLVKKSIRSGKKSMSSGITEKSKSQEIPPEQALPKSRNENEGLVPGAPSDMDTSTDEQQASLESDPNLDSERKIAGGDLESETVKPALGSSESCDEYLSRTALILKFSDLESVPSEKNLKKIFSRYGPLTEVMRNNRRATLVFEKRTDAETAFSSTGKYSTFGPSLVGYSLKYLPSKPSKAASSTNAKKRGRKCATAPEGNATK